MDLNLYTFILFEEKTSLTTFSKSSPLFLQSLPITTEISLFLNFLFK